MPSKVYSHLRKISLKRKLSFLRHNFFEFRQVVTCNGIRRYAMYEYFIRKDRNRFIQNTTFGLTRTNLNQAMTSREIIRKLCARLIDFL